jgi:hypothetical protein
LRRLVAGDLVVYQSAFGGRNGTLQRGDDEVGRSLDMLLDLLPLEETVLLDEAPADPH